MDIVIIEIDLGKNSCSLAGMDALGRVVLRRRMRRSSLESFAKGLGRCMIAMEAFWAASSPLGHEVRLMSPEYVRPYGAPRRRGSLVEEDSTQRVVD
jgi:transposase